MSEISTSPPPSLTAVSYSGAGCFPAVIGISVLGLGFAQMIGASLQAFLILSGIAGLCIWFAFHLGREQRNFAKHSVVLQGSITRVWYSIVEDSESGKSTHYYLAYTFPGGKETKQTITADQYLFAKPGDAVTVRYDPEQPKLSQIDWALMRQEKLSTTVKV